MGSPASDREQEKNSPSAKGTEEGMAEVDPTVSLVDLPTVVTEEVSTARVIRESNTLPNESVEEVVVTVICPEGTMMLAPESL